MRTMQRARSYVPALALVALAGPAWAQVESIFQPIGMDTARSFSHLSLPGATGIDFSFSGAFAPMYAPEESHSVVMVFEWGPSVAGPWSISPDMVKTVPGGTTAFFDSGVFHGPIDAPFVRLHFYAGGLMTAAGSFSHISVVPEPVGAALLAAGLALLLGWRRAHKSQ